MADDFSTDLKKEDIDEIIAQFGLQFKTCQAYRRVWKVETSEGVKYLKKSKLSTAEIRFIDEAQRFLYHQNFTHLPKLAWSRHHEPFVTFRENLYILTDWYLGTELDFRILMDLKQASRFLAKFHMKSAGFKPSQPIPERTCWLGWPRKLEERLKQMRDFQRLANLEKESSVFSRLYLRNFGPFYQQAVASFEALLKSSYPKVAEAASTNLSFCHHDYSGRNILRTYEDQLLLVDFDYCLLDLRIHDLINLMVRNLKHNGWRLEVSDFILNEYETVSPLTAEELDVMYVLLCWPQDFWQVGLQYYYEKLPWPKERFIKKLRHKIYYRGSRNRFLYEFSQKHKIESTLEIDTISNC
jgi:CotS family spore coat protein